VDRSRLRFALRWSGLSQAQAARSAGILSQRITDDLAGRRRLPPAQVAALAAVLNVEPSWLEPPPATPRTSASPPPDTHPVAALMRPVQVQLPLHTWGELLVLGRLLQRNATDGTTVDGAIAGGLVQRLAIAAGLDVEALMAAATMLERL
jgi:transcriptional regulator with XRE-family HTH domain